MTGLVTENRLADPDAALRLLVEAHRPLSEAESADLNARLVLILANHIGDQAVLAEALALAAATLSRSTSVPTTRA
ncbi:MAG: DUF2783 domain-containing protein [Phreatobacter sp.]|nr:DUF2783 domain-containing protein [Phreatobacter sp.]